MVGTTIIARKRSGAAPRYKYANTAFKPRRSGGATMVIHE
jgi:hypothetical protein